MDATERVASAFVVASRNGALLLFLLLGTSAHPGAAAQPVERPPEAPERIVSLLPAATELIAALGAGPRVVGRTIHDSEPAVADAAVVGDPVRPNAELVLSLRPDLLVTWSGITDPRLATRLESSGTPVYAARMESVADVARTARELGVLLGLAPEGAALATALTEGLRALSDSAPPPGRRPSVLLLLDAGTLLTVGPGSFAHELVVAAGGRNVFADAAVPWPRVSPESVLARDPDVVVVAERPGAPAESAGTVWTSLRAVREGRVLRMPTDLLTRPGPELVRVARTLARFFRAGAPR